MEKCVFKNSRNVVSDGSDPWFSEREVLYDSQDDICLKTYNSSHFGGLQYYKNDSNYYFISLRL